MRLSILALTLFTPAAFAQDVNYYPLKDGSAWRYKLSANGRVLEVTNRLAKIEDVGGEKLATIETIINDAVQATEQVSSTAKGVFRHNFSGMDVVPKLPLVRLPLKDGDAWETDITIGTEKAKIQCKLGKDKVTVPAGKYDAITVQVETEQGGQKVSSKYWFAPGVGPVKQTIKLGGIDAVMELEKYTDGK